MPSKDVKKYLLITSEFGKEIPGGIDLYITNNRLNETSFKHRLNPISKTTIKNQNPIKLLFKDVKISSLIQEVDIAKKKGLRRILNKTP